MTRGRPRALSPSEEQRCIEALADASLSNRECLAKLKPGIPCLTYSTLMRVLGRHRDDPRLLAGRQRRVGSRRAGQVERDRAQALQTGLLKGRRQWGRPPRFTAEEEAEIKSLIETAGSIAKARLLMNGKYPEASNTKLREIQNGQPSRRASRDPTPRDPPTRGEFGRACLERGIRYGPLASRLDRVFDQPRIGLTASEICEFMKNDGMGASKISIRRKLSQLAEAGVLEVERKPNGWLYTWNSPPESSES